MYRNRAAKRPKTKEDKIEWNFTIVGRSAMGKSSTGNTILGKKSFPVCSNHQTSDHTIRYDRVTTKQEELLSVIDASGICDSAQDRAETRNNRHFTMKGDLATLKQIFEKRVENALTTVVTILVFVFKFGSGRFTTQEKNAVRQAKTLFGEDVFRKFGVLIVTGGDIFDNNDSYPEFTQWIKSQTGDFGELVKECNWRCVLFNNITRNEEKAIHQMDQIWRCAVEVRQISNGTFLTWSDDGMERLIWDHDLDAFNKEIELHQQQLADIENDHLSETRSKLEAVRNVQNDLTRLKLKDKGYDVTFTNKLSLLQGRTNRLIDAYKREMGRKRNCYILAFIVVVAIIVTIGVVCVELT